MLKIILTFDYELFFNDSYYSENEVLIQPTSELLNVLNKNQVKGTFFADVSSIIRYKEIGEKLFPKLAENQLKTILSTGHDVELHIHPHWYTSARMNGKWQFDNTHYRIHTFGFDKSRKNNASTIITESVTYLNKLLKTINESYQCLAFRAGGFCLQPEIELLKVLKSNGITIDSSICKNMYKDTGIHYYSFNNLPKELNWWISPVSGIEKSAPPSIENHLYEIPIGSIRKKPLKWILSKGYPKIFPKQLKGKQTPVALNTPNSKKRIIDYLRSLWCDSLIFTLDSLHYLALEKIVQYYLNTYDCNSKDQYVATLCHPKFLDDGVLRNIDQFISTIKNNYKNVEFITIKDAYREIKRASD